MTKIMGGKAAAVVTASANLSAADFCVAIDVAAADGVSSIVDIGGGSITASHVAFTFAPAGCTIGAGVSAVTYPAGYLMSFTGTIMKTSVAVSLSITYVGAFVTVSGSAVFGAITLGDLKLDATTVEITMTDTPGGNEHFKLSGGATLFGAKLSVVAEANYTLGTISGSVMLTASLSNLTIGGFGLEDIYLSVNLSSAAPQDFSIAFGAKVPILPGVLVAGSGKITPTQVYLDVDATIKWGSFWVGAKGSVFLGTSNGSTTFAASIKVGLTVMGQDLVASLVIATDSNGANFSVSFPISFAPFGWLTFQLYAGCTWKSFPGGAVIGARVYGSLYALGGVITGTIDASVSLGSDVDGKPTLLTNMTVGVKLGITWVADVTGTLKFTNCNSTCTSYASPTMTLSASTTWKGNTVSTGDVVIPMDFTFSISSSSSFEKTSGVAYGCLNCENPGSAGLLRWQAYFKGSASFTFSSSGKLSTSISASAEIQQSASKGTCTKWTDTVVFGKVCDKTDYSWGSFTKLIGVGISIDSGSGDLRASSANRDYSA
jgi:hypothetical protein